MKSKRIERMKTIIRKHVETMETTNWSQEANSGYESQYEENKESVIEELKTALEENCIEEINWCIEEAGRLERRGGFDAIYTAPLQRTLAETEAPMSWQEWRAGLKSIDGYYDFIASLDVELYEKARGGETFVFFVSTKNKDKGSLERLWEDFLAKNAKWYGRGVVSGGSEEHVSALRIPDQKDIKSSYLRHEVEERRTEPVFLWTASTADEYGYKKVRCQIKHTSFTECSFNRCWMTIDRTQNQATIGSRRYDEEYIIKNFSSLEKGESVAWYVMKDGKETRQGEAEIVGGSLKLLSTSILGYDLVTYPLSHVFVAR